VRFRKSLRAFAKVEMRTRLLGWDTAWFYLEQTLSSRGELVCVAYLRGVFLKGGRRVPVEELLQSIGLEDPSPLLPEALKAWIQADEAMYAGAKQAE
jgi:hypothetical protein